ncbi:hypothetical protein Tco_1463231, partial [Tanacetum coccineum]
TKHIDIRYHWIRDSIEDGMFELNKVHTDDNASDMLTKAIAREKASLRKRKKKKIFGVLITQNPAAVFRRSLEFAPSDHHDFWTEASLNIKEGFHRWDLDFEAWEICFLPGQIIKDSFKLSFHAWYLDDGIIIGDTLVVGKEDVRSILVGIFPPTIARPLHGVKVLGDPVSVDFDFGCELVWKRVAKSIELIDVVAKLNDPQCELLLLHACAEHIVTASGAGFGNVLGYAFLASRLQSASLQTSCSDILVLYLPGLPLIMP